MSASAAHMLDHDGLAPSSGGNLDGRRENWREDWWDGFAPGRRWWLGLRQRPGLAQLGGDARAEDVKEDAANRLAAALVLHVQTAVGLDLPRGVERRLHEGGTQGGVGASQPVAD